MALRVNHDGNHRLLSWKQAAEACFPAFVTVRLESKNAETSRRWSEPHFLAFLALHKVDRNFWTAARLQYLVARDMCAEQTRFVLQLDA